MRRVSKGPVRAAEAVALALVLAGCGSAPRGAAPDRGVRLVADEAGRRVDVLVDGKPFTSYLQPDHVYKPILYPLRTARGTIVTRGFPIAPRARERTDHPHQVGAWLNYGDVNGIDFWGHSDAIKPEERAKMGTIRYRRSAHKAQAGGDRAVLAVSADWLRPDGSVLLDETTAFVFRIAPDWRAIDRVTTLTAAGERVAFNDTKEGMFGIRVCRALEQPADKPEVFTDASGNPTTVPVLDNAGVTGLYASSEGKTGDAVWGTRARWVMLTGTVEGEAVTLAVLDHPKNPGHPTYWHARGYGLFSANPLGVKDFTKGKDVMNFAIEPGRSATFRYRIVILSRTATAEKMEEEYKRFVAEIE